MPSPERPAESQPEQERVLYCRTARFVSPEHAQWTDDQLQGAISTAAWDGGTCRYQLNQAWHLTVLGAPPSPDLEEEIDTFLAPGITVELEPDLLHLLVALHAEG